MYTLDTSSRLACVCVTRVCLRECASVCARLCRCAQTRTAFRPTDTLRGQVLRARPAAKRPRLRRRRKRSSTPPQAVRPAGRPAYRRKRLSSGAAPRLSRSLVREKRFAFFDADSHRVCVPTRCTRRRCCPCARGRKKKVKSAVESAPRAFRSP